MLLVPSRRNPSTRDRTIKVPLNSETLCILPNLPGVRCPISLNLEQHVSADQIPDQSVHLTSAIYTVSVKRSKWPLIDTTIYRIAPRFEAGIATIIRPKTTRGICRTTTLSALMVKFQSFDRVADLFAFLRIASTFIIAHRSAESSATIMSQRLSAPSKRSPWPLASPIARYGKPT